MSNLTDNEIETLVMLAERAGDALGVGSWSIDMLGCYDGWFVTDVALASNSWHWPSCPFTECSDDTNDEESLIMEGMELL